MLHLGVPEGTSGTTVITLLGYSGALTWHKDPKGGIAINIPHIPFNKMPCDWAWVFKMTSLQNYSSTTKTSNVQVVG